MIIDLASLISRDGAHRVFAGPERYVSKRRGERHDSRIGKPYKVMTIYEIITAITKIFPLRLKFKAFLLEKNGKTPYYTLNHHIVSHEIVR